MRSSFVMDQPFCQIERRSVNRHARIAGDRVRECTAVHKTVATRRSGSALLAGIGVRGVAQLPSQRRSDGTGAPGSRSRSRSRRSRADVRASRTGRAVRRRRRVGRADRRRVPGVTTR